ncbi:tRNA (guanine(26)-N(2))-dimethyltransferase isoform X2 [Prosopis cineraria]|uniref:tRNA (guanine(26)-N(2))-dimethyltransferase isoform X2 n=1 Tax=Prosopis cineraria TaxID=364024 RepID=UPI00241025CC|nr:tRNA (guanine(26)-N(2))-dimethyltransferase isoform X2 [Prosopis cineraria]
MLTLAPKTLSASPFSLNPIAQALFHDSNFSFKLKFNRKCKCEYQTERGLQFETGEAFFRSESATGRDLGVLAAALHKKSNGSLRVLDALCGCGIRSLRYLEEAGADFVVANDGNDSYRSTIVENLSRANNCSENERRWEITHLEANRVMTDYYLQKNFFDFIDIDSFGSDSSFLRSAIISLKLGGLLYVTSTDGYSSGGHRPHQHYGFIGYCHQCGNSKEFSWDELGQLSCSCSNSKVSTSLVVSGPLWTGPLHDAAYLMDMLYLAQQWGWVDGMDNLGKLIKLMMDESDPKLPFGYIKLDEMASRAKMNSPPLRTLMSAIHKKGFAASRSHIASNAIKTNCPMTECISIAKELLLVRTAE